MNLGLAKILKDSREAAGLSQMETAKKMGWSSPQFVSNIERGLCNPTDAYLQFAINKFNLDKQLMFNRIVGKFKSHYKVICGV